jgi:chaperonin GroEL
MEVSETRDLVEDALFAVRAALEEGYVVGGGFALANAALRIDPEELSQSDNQTKLGIDLVI